MTPILNTSSFNHGSPSGVAFTVQHESEVLISPEDLIKCITADTCSNVLIVLLNQIGKSYDNHNGYFSTGFAIDGLSDEAKEYFKELGKTIEELGS